MSIQRSNGSGPLFPTERNSSGSKADGAKTRGGDRIAGQDRIDLSPKAQEALRLEEAAREIPEIRQERVDSIREQIRLGRYGFDSEKLSRLLVDADVL